jgi:hypothetical protein
MKDSWGFPGFAINLPSVSPMISLKTKVNNPPTVCSVNAETFRHMCQRSVQLTLRLTP